MKIQKLILGSLLVTTVAFGSGAGQEMSRHDEEQSSTIRDNATKTSRSPINDFEASLKAVTMKPGYDQLNNPEQAREYAKQLLKESDEIASKKYQTDVYEALHKQCPEIKLRIAASKEREADEVLASIGEKQTDDEKVERRKIVLTKRRNDVKEISEILTESMDGNDGWLMYYCTQISTLRNPEVQPLMPEFKSFVERNGELYAAWQRRMNFMESLARYASDDRKEIPVAEMEQSEAMLDRVQSGDILITRLERALDSVRENCTKNNSAGITEGVNVAKRIIKEFKETFGPSAE